MRIQQIRNATLLIEYAGQRFLVDPMLAEKGAYPGIEGTANSHLTNPLVDLPAPVDRLLDIDAAIVTHTHWDHWDEAAKERLPKDLLILAQDDQDAASIRSDGFTNVRTLAQRVDLGGIELHRTPGQHGSDEAMRQIGSLLGEVCGVVFKHPSEKTVYLAGDTVWNEQVGANLKKHQPDIVILNCGDAQITGLGSIIMNKEDVREAHRAAPKALLIASHMEAVNHCHLSRSALRAFAEAEGFGEFLRVPEDGEALAF